MGIETQGQYLASKKTWTRKIVLITDGENPIEVEDWEATAKKMNSLNLGFTLVSVYLPSLMVRISTIASHSGVDFDDEEFPYTEPDKSNFKVNESSFLRIYVY